MKSNRHVPLIIGLFSIGIALWLIIYFSGWWKFIPAVLLLAFGWPSIKTAISASDKEIRELTGEDPVSEETQKKFRDRV